ncbi:MAG TPA: hypothetical protein VND90_09595 [Terracidiphilus sp.]|nr:hypothetical protein [Terracidiphilus sp.]
MRPNNCTFDEYRTWLQDECNAIVLQPGFSIVTPIIVAGKDPLPPWTIKFAIIYDDGMYIRIYEHYRELAKKDGGGGRLHILSYHYGPCSEERDEDGFPYKEDNCVLRIDIDTISKRHAHYNGENHIPEERLVGLNFETISLSDFIRAVENHRKTSKPLPGILGFEVKAAQ